MPLITAYNPLPIAFKHGQGVWLEDTQGKRYLDALSGIAVCCLGHSHPAVTKTICKQAEQLIHTSNLYQISAQNTLAEKLTKLAGMQQIFFGNSGSEANEAAIKLARLYGHQRGIDNPKIIVMDNSFHGRTMGALSATCQRKVQAGFEPLLPGFLRCPFNDIQTLHDIAQNNHDIVAILAEPIQGEGGINISDKNYLNKLRELCDEHEWLLMLDEIQTGMGRTGRFFDYEHNGIKPDIVTLAKALANGIPIGACIIGEAACDLFEPGNHGSTFGGNPLACQTALTVIDEIQTQKLAQHAEKLGDYLLQQLHTHLSPVPHVKDIRGRGLMLGIELDKPCRELLSIGLQQGILFSIVQDRIIRLLPPLILQLNEADELIKRLITCIDKLYY